MKPGLTRVLMPIALMLAGAACTSPAPPEAAWLPPTDITTTLPPTTTTQPPTTTSSPARDAGPDIIAWMSRDAATATLAEAVAAWQGVGGVELVTSEEALSEFALLHEDRPELVEGVTATALPASLRIELSHPSFLGEVASQLRSLSDVEDVATAVTPLCNAFPGWNVVVFVDDDRQLTRLRNELAEVDDISEITAVGRDEAHAEYLTRFSELSELTGSITVQDMSVSLRARTENPVTLTLLAHRFEGDDAVKGVQVFPPGAPDCP
jgi:hypothetical protein